MTRCMSCRNRFTPARPNHRLCWPCWRKVDHRQPVADDDDDVVQLLKSELGARVIGRR
jgi:hypothetical protein